MLRFLSFLKRTAPPADTEPPPYRAFTTKFDRVVRAREIQNVLGPVPPVEFAALEDAWRQFQVGLAGWKTKLQIQALAASSEIRRKVTDEDRADTVVSILIDHSGSMRGQRILMAAAAADVLQDFLLQLGYRVEVLGFTTSSWHGGQSRRHWQFSRSPKFPGRICDLLYIVYRAADDTASAGAGWSFQPMLRPDLLKENVDGEALLWAAGRLAGGLASNRVLLVISDGAPVDDATLGANDLGILHRHLQEVIGQIEAAGDIELAAVGIGYDVSRYYSNATVVTAPDDLGSVLLHVAETLLLKTAPSHTGAAGDGGSPSPDR